MKKLITSLLALVMIFSLCACGHNAEDSSAIPDTNDEQESTTKGTRADPYLLGEEITFHTTDIKGENQFDVALTVSDLSSSEIEEAEKLWKPKNVGVSTGFLSLTVTISSQDGNYSGTVSNRTNSNGGFYVNALTENMTESYCNFFPLDSGKYIEDFYTDNDYDLFLTFADEGKYKYLTFTYLAGEYEEAVIWVDISQSNINTTK